MILTKRINECCGLLLLYNLSFPHVVSVAISACAAGIGIFDCSLCALNHSALQHVNEAIHRRVTRAAPSCFGRESPWVVPARAKRVSQTFDAPPERIFIPSLYGLFRGFLFLPALSLSFYRLLVSRGSNFSSGKFATRATAPAKNFLAFAGVFPSENRSPPYLSYEFPRDIRET